MQRIHSLSQSTNTNRDAQSEGRKPGALVVSLDFELHWGVRDHAVLDAAERRRLLSARAAVTRILDLFQEFEIHATWATVGLLFARSKAEAEEFSPHIKPNYRHAELDPYREVLGRDEGDDPFHFAPSLIAEIAGRPHQEIGSHSFSHYYCLEKQESTGAFAADLYSAMAISARYGVKVESYVFARNQIHPTCLKVLESAGLSSYRGTEPAGAKAATDFQGQRKLHKRALRLADDYLDVCGLQTSSWPPDSRLVCLEASRYLRSCRTALMPLDALRLRRIERAMHAAAIHGEMFHLWWHPEDFAFHTGANLRFLRRILTLFNGYRTRYEMLSLSMHEAAQKARQLAQRYPLYESA